MNYKTFQDRFQTFGIFSIDQVRAFDPGFDRGNFRTWMQKGYLLRLRRGWYAFRDCLYQSGMGEVVASRIYSPSYLSLEYALARYELIPESVVQWTSVTSLKTASFANAFGEFSYRSLKPELMFGYRVLTAQESRQAIYLATPEKALLDYLYLSTHLQTESDMDYLRLDADVLREICSTDVLESFLERFHCHSLEARVSVMRKVYGL